MTLDQVTSYPPIRGMDPDNDVAIDANVWRQAHDIHHRHFLLHNISAHRPGIITGLEVFRSPTNEHAVMVAPGVAVDGDGHIIVLREPVTLAFDESKEGVEKGWGTGDFYIILRFQRNEDPRSGKTANNRVQCYPYEETGAALRIETEPGSKDVELARIYRSDPEMPVKEAKNPFDPGSDEIDLLRRQAVSPPCIAEVGVAEISIGLIPNRAGLWYLVRAGNAQGFHLQFLGLASLAGIGRDQFPTLFYMAGEEAFSPLSERQVEGLARALSNGALLFVESWGEGFRQSFEELAEQLGANLREVGAKHPLLTAHHVFAAPPPGAQDHGTLTLDDDLGVLLSTHNYGGAWQGQVPHPNAADARERIRAAQEFGLNIIVYAAERVRRRQRNGLIPLGAPSVSE